MIERTRSMEKYKLNLKLVGQLAKTDTSELQPYLDAGWQLIPLHRWDAADEYKGKRRERGKTPLHLNWTKRSYRSDEQVAHMESGSNIGVRLTAGQLVIDVDPRNGGDAGLERMCGDPLALFDGSRLVEATSSAVEVLEEVLLAP
jgi:hypothetical protein